MTNSQTQTGMINDFVMFSLNFPSDFIKQAWTGTQNEWVISHLEEKFSEAYDIAGSYGAMIKFYTMLDRTNQEILENYISNYYE